MNAALAAWNRFKNPAAPLHLLGNISWFAVLGQHNYGWSTRVVAGDNGGVLSLCETCSSMLMCIGSQLSVVLSCVSLVVVATGVVVVGTSSWYGTSHYCRCWRFVDIGVVIDAVDVVVFTAVSFPHVCLLLLPLFPYRDLSRSYLSTSLWAHAEVKIIIWTPKFSSHLPGRLGAPRHQMRRSTTHTVHLSWRPLTILCLPRIVSKETQLRMCQPGSNRFDFILNNVWCLELKLKVKKTNKNL